ncbi:MAG: tyrosine-type recombinase/integrase [Actinomycetota bacterium]|nr:tyrosine-type recombinase/integrase [Actinomycetota bacterium]
MVATSDPVALARLEQLAEQAGRYVDAAKAEATIRAYRSDWAEFSAWADHRGLVALPATPETVALYLVELAEVAKASTIARRLSSISQAHRAAGHPSPTASARVQAVATGIRRVHGAGVDQAAPITVGLLRRMLEVVPPGLGGTRDRALLLVGFAGALRRSELVALAAEDLDEVDEGVVVTITKSKTDQEGAGRSIGVPYGSNLLTCPVRALDAWMQTARISSGPVFLPVDRHGRLDPGRRGRLSPVAVNRLIKTYAARIGLDPDHYGAHSLRAGLATSAAEAGVSERAIMNQTGHRSLPVMRGYIRSGTLFKENAAAQVGL